jgi:MOSC domain-containing protein YiiM
MKDSATVRAVHASAHHRFSKDPATEVAVIAGIGVEGDAHSGSTVQHRSRVAIDPTRPNLRQVHLIDEELLAELAEDGHQVAPGQLGENITTSGLDLLGLPTGASLRIGAEALLIVSGLRNPCRQIDAFQGGLLSKVLDRDDDGRLVRKAGVMAVVIQSGIIRPNDLISVSLPPQPHARLEPV